MNGKWFLVFVLAALIVLLAATLAQAAYSYYSEDFEGAVAPASIAGAPFAWTARNGGDLFTGTGDHAGYGNYLDGSSMTGGSDRWWTRDPITPLPTAKTGVFELTSTMWSWAPSTAGSHLNWFGLCDPTIWSAYAWVYTWGSGTSNPAQYSFGTSWGIDIQTGKYFDGEAVTAKIILDYDAGKIRATLTAASGSWDSGLLAMDPKAQTFSSVIYRRNTNNRNTKGLDVDNISLTGPVIPEPGSLLALATGLAGLLGIRRSRRTA